MDATTQLTAKCGQMCLEMEAALFSFFTVRTEGGNREKAVNRGWLAYRTCVTNWRVLECHVGRSEQKFTHNLTVAQKGQKNETGICKNSGSYPVAQ